MTTRRVFFVFLLAAVLARAAVPLCPNQGPSPSAYGMSPSVNTGCSRVSGVLSPDAQRFLSLGATATSFTGADNSSFFTNGDVGNYPTPDPYSDWPQAVLVSSVDEGDGTLAAAVNSDLSCMISTGVTNGSPSGGGIDLNGGSGYSNDIGGLTLIPAAYYSASSIAITGTVVLDGCGNPDATFLFYAGSTIITASGATVTLANGVRACNVFWVSGGSIALEADTAMQGTMMAVDAVTLASGAQVTGRLFSQAGAITYENNSVTMPSCVSSTATKTGCASCFFTPALAPGISPIIAPAPVVRAVPPPPPTPTVIAALSLGIIGTSFGFIAFCFAVGIVFYWRQRRPVRA